MQEKTAKDLIAENAELRIQLEEAQETLDAIRRGEVDGLVVSTPKGEQVYTITGAEKPYRILIEKMHEGAVMLSDENTILYCNIGFASMMKAPLEKLVGSNIENMVSPTFKENFKGFLAHCRGVAKKEATEAWSIGITFMADDHSLVPTQVSANSLSMDDTTTTFIVVTDLTQHMEKELKRYTSDLEKASQALYISEQRWSTTLDSIGDAVIATDLVGRVTFMNAVATELTGWSITEASGKPVQEVFRIINEKSRKTVDDPVSKVIAKGKVVGLANHTILIRKDKKEMAIDDSAAPIKDKHGKIIGVVLIFRDITERRKTEEEINKQASLIDLSPDAIIVMNSSGEATFWSLGAEKLYGWKKSEVLGKRIHELLETKFLEPYENIIRKLKQIGSWSGELVQCNKAGKEIVIESRWLPKVDASGKIVEILKSNVDITKRKESENKLKEYRDNLEKIVEERTKKLELSSLYARNLIEASLDPLVTISVEGKITDVNEATELATGCSREELIGSDFSDYFVEPEKAKMGYKQAFAEGVVKNYPLAIKHTNGRIISVLYNATVYRNNAGEVQGVFAAARDITEQKKAEAEAQQAAKKLKDAERLAAIGATAGMVGHDIRNPLQAITGDLYLAKEELKEIPDGETKQELQESFNSIEENIFYINKIVSDLQDFTRTLKLTAEPVNLKGLLDKIIVETKIPSKIQTQLISEEETIIKTDPAYLRRALTNLVTNAMQAMPDGGKLTIQTHKEKVYAVISVKDTGVGIPEEVKSNLFTPLFTTKSKGQGLGLAVVKRFIDAMNGTICFESQVGKGTTFTITLPLNKQ
jgi:PAS domain S-box-containing protein